MRFFPLPFLSLFSSSALILSTGCVHKNMRDDAPAVIAEEVEVIFDWSKAPDHNAQNMLLYLYPEDHEMIDHWFSNPNGGIIRTYAGKQTAICHNQENSFNFYVRNSESHENLEIYTESSNILAGQGISTRNIPRAPGTENEPIRSTPPLCYGTQRRDIFLNPSDHRQTLIFQPEELVCRYTVDFIDVENLKSADLRIDATVSSLAGGYRIGTLSSTEESVSHSFTLYPLEDMTSLHSEFFTFGVPAGEIRPHYISVYIALRNRSGNLYNYDVSDQINAAPDPRNVHIRIYGLKLPEIPDDPPDPPDEGGDMSITIGNWEVEYFDLPL